MEYMIGFIVVCGGFALICLTIKWVQNAFMRAMHRKYVAMGAVPTEVEAEETRDIFYDTTSLSLRDTFSVTNINHDL